MSNIIIRPSTSVVAKPDTFYVFSGDTLTVTALDGLLENDYDTGSAAITATSYSQTAHGLLNVSLDGSLTYTPNAGFIGSDTFTYFIRDTSGHTASAVATIDVVQPLIVAAPDTFAMTSNGTLTLDAAHGLLTNDISTGGSVYATSYSQTAHGLLNVSIDGGLTYTPNAGFIGTDTFTYYISNGTETAWTTATIDVVDAPPVANADAYTMRAGQTLTVDAAHGLLANDIDPGGTVVATSYSQTSHGLVNVSIDGSLTYTPNPGFTGVDTFTYYISDGAQTASAVATIDVVDKAPVAAADYYRLVANSTLTVGAAAGLLANDFDADGDPIHATSYSQTSHGLVSVSLDGGITYTPNAGYVGTDSFTYYISDGALTSSATVTLEVGAGIVANPDTFHDDAGSTLIVNAAHGLLANDYPAVARGATLTATSFSQTGHGLVNVSIDGSLTYTPNAGYVGADSFTYYIVDSGGHTASALATIDVVQPSLVAAPDAFATKANGVLTIDAAHGLLANDLSTGGTLVATSFSQTAHGLLNVSIDGGLTYTPNAGFVGTDTFTYYISNGYQTASTTATIDVVDAKPVANADAYTSRAGQTLTVDAAHGLLANDIDPGGTVVATSFSQTAHGLLNVSLDGSITYTPNPGFTGVDTFTYYISDGAQTASAVATIDVLDQAPVAANDYFHVTENGSLTVGAAGGLLANDFDADGDPIHATSFSQTSHGLVNVSLDGSVTYTPNTGYVGADSFTYYITDGALTASATATIDVVACFCAGTLIATANGPRRVEDLTIGELLQTSSGEIRPITWIGKRTVATPFGDPIRCWPIRVTAGALDKNVPSRDLLLSPDHALLVEDVLIQAGALVNGKSIVRETAVAPVFVYYHVELDDHSLILAENAPAETFIDNVDRMAFDNWAEHETLYPEGKPIEEMPFPRAKARRQVPVRIRAALDERAGLIRAEESAAVA